MWRRLLANDLSTRWHAPPWQAVAAMVGIVGAATIVGLALAHLGEFRNLALVFLPGVLYAAVTWGQGLGAIAAALSTIAYNFFFMFPLNAFGIPQGIDDVLTMSVLLATALITGSLATRARDHARAAEAERFGSALLGSISHDLRTPLATILGSASTLLSQAPLQESARRELLLGILEETRRLERFIRNLLEMTRLQSGGLRPNLQTIEPGEVIGETLAKLRRRLDGHELVLEIAPDLPLVPMDAVLIEHVLENLIDNAVRHTPSGKRIGVGARCAGDRLLILVDDEGHGIAPEDRSRVFDRFFSLQHPGRRASRTGLGLTICRGFVEAHRGTISATESAWGGARFTIALPSAA